MGLREAFKGFCDGLLREDNTEPREDNPKTQLEARQNREQLRRKDPELARRLELFEGIWGALSVGLPEGGTQRFQTMFQRPENTIVQRNKSHEQWPWDVEISRRESENGTQEISFESQSQWPWGHPNTCSDINFQIPLATSNATMEARALSLHFPASKIRVVRRGNDLSIITVCDSNEFDYRSTSDEGEHEANLRTGGGRTKVFSRDEQMDLDRQIMEGMVLIMGELLGAEGVDLTILPPQLEGVLGEVREKASLALGRDSHFKNKLKVLEGDEPDQYYNEEADVA